MHQAKRPHEEAWNLLVGEWLTHTEDRGCGRPGTGDVAALEAGWSRA